MFFGLPLHGSPAANPPQQQQAQTPQETPPRPEFDPRAETPTRAVAAAAEQRREEEVAAARARGGAPSPPWNRAVAPGCAPQLPPRPVRFQSANREPARGSVAPSAMQFWQLCTRALNTVAAMATVF